MERRPRYAPHRNPLLLLRLSGVLPKVRYAARTLFQLLLNDPPRSTRRRFPARPAILVDGTFIVKVFTPQVKYQMPFSASRPTVCQSRQSSWKRARTDHCS